MRAHRLGVRVYALRLRVCARRVSVRVSARVRVPAHLCLRVVVGVLHVRTKPAAQFADDTKSRCRTRLCPHRHRRVSLSAALVLLSVRAPARVSVNEKVRVRIRVEWLMQHDQACHDRCRSLSASLLLL